MNYDLLKEPHVIIDCSYFVYNRAFTALTWAKDEFKFQYPYNHPEDIYNFDFIKHDEYQHFFESIFMKSVHQYLNELYVRPSRCILALDCERSRIWRKSIYPAYKANRDNKKNKPNFGGVFKYTYDILVPRLIKEYGMHSIKVDGAEADDVIYIAATKLATNPDNRIFVCSIDSDLTQFASESISILPLNRTEPIDKKIVEDYGSVQRFLLHKILSGDTSDNIPSIKFRKMGEVTAHKMIRNPELLKEFFTTYPEAIAQYKINRQIVDLKNIPSDLVATIHNKVDEVISTFK